jgi:hypothetical protein
MKYIVIVTLFFFLHYNSYSMFPTGPLIAFKNKASELHSESFCDEFKIEITDNFKQDVKKFAKHYVANYILPSPLSLTQKALKTGAVALLPYPHYPINFGPLKISAKAAVEQFISVFCALSIIIPRYFKANNKYDFIQETCYSLLKEPIMWRGYNEFVQKLSMFSGSSERIGLYPEFIKNNEFFFSIARYIWHKHVNKGMGPIMDWGKEKMIQAL